MRVPSFTQIVLIMLCAGCATNVPDNNNQGSSSGVVPISYDQSSLYELIQARVLFACANMDFLWIHAAVDSNATDRPDFISRIHEISNCSPLMTNAFFRTGVVDGYAFTISTGPRCTVENKEIKETDVGRQLYLNGWFLGCSRAEEDMQFLIEREMRGVEQSFQTIGEPEVFPMAPTD